MPRPTALAVTVALLLAACGSTGGKGDPPFDRGAAADDCDGDAYEALAAWETAGLSGSVALTTHGEPDCLAGFGLAECATGRPNTAETVFAIGSVSKAVTAVAVLGLVDSGRITLDDRAGELVPGLGGPAADASVRDLLLHTSGLSGDHGVDRVPLSHDAAVAAISELQLAVPPGTEFLYSNAGYTLLALVVENVTGTH